MYSIEWRIKESVAAASHNWHLLDSFLLEKDLDIRMESLNDKGNIEFRVNKPSPVKKKQVKKREESEEIVLEPKKKAPQQDLFTEIFDVKTR